MSTNTQNHFLNFLEICREIGRVFSPLLDAIPLNRDGQRMLSLALQSYLDINYPDICNLLHYVAKRCIVDEGKHLEDVMQNDTSAWFFLHEGVANYFAFMLKEAYAGMKISIFHHTPKTGGTSVVSSFLNNDIPSFCQVTDFSTMMTGYGLLPLSRLVNYYDTLPADQQYLVYSGHFSLTDFVLNNKIGPTVRCASVCSYPDKIVDSGIRYFLTKLHDRTEWKEFSCIDLELVDEVVLLLTSGCDLDVSKKHTVKHLIDKICDISMDSGWFVNPLRKFYLGQTVGSTKDLAEFFMSFPEIKCFPRSSSLISLWLCEKSLELPWMNKSIVTSRILTQCIGDDYMSKIIQRFVDASEYQIYACIEDVFFNKRC